MDGDGRKKWTKFGRRLAAVVVVWRGVSLNKFEFVKTLDREIRVRKPRFRSSSKLQKERERGRDLRCLEVDNNDRVDGDDLVCLFFKQEMELSLIGLQNAGKTSLVNVVAIPVILFPSIWPEISALKIAAAN
ncbi:hypothetical protein Vadar_011941 [Vaccinium darrowii]|uniref:Uncharacterized protein n=1 Tax=Vaccinium darrowii TaxID=229202 RepID=A0ACB7Y040_9ERIC|nr:hypothetical protein Vadar_011941 [Vaccinium darrowii]